jgi:hypothetical protein
LIMQLLRDNLNLWTSDIPEDSGKIWLIWLPHTDTSCPFFSIFKLLLIGPNHGYQNRMICVVRILIRYKTEPKYESLLCIYFGYETHFEFRFTTIQITIWILIW